MVCSDEGPPLTPLRGGSTHPGYGPRNPRSLSLERCVIGGEVLHVLIAQSCRDTAHHRIAASAGLEFLQCLDLRGRGCSCECREGRISLTLITMASGT